MDRPIFKGKEDNKHAWKCELTGIGIVILALVIAYFIVRIYNTYSGF